MIFGKMSIVSTYFQSVHSIFFFLDDFAFGTFVDGICFEKWIAILIVVKCSELLKRSKIQKKFLQNETDSEKVCPSNPETGEVTRPPLTVLFPLPPSIVAK